ncbi:hypothetical protein KPH14_012527 [Odynerus spinipes]|uniref:RING-type domain-containing protein n=1 Tax=Odynerus spinipes TaxID=1348599 RepID=A0AAD9RJI8_9HYME|nr:hypothetical protein KPH14_012527 [Odynerus spinipes]
MINEASTAFVDRQYHTACYKYKAALQLLSTSNINIKHINKCALQYTLCITLLESNTLQDILQALETLIKLEENTENFLAVYYAMGKAYIKLYRFNSALVAINKGLAILNAGTHFQEFCIPMTSIVVRESTKEGLLTALLSLHDEASRWHCPDAKCYLENCQNYVSHCLPCRDIFFRDPAFTGLIVITCSNANNPCKLTFHPVCWNFQKEKLCSKFKLTDKEIIGRLCFTLNCESNESMSVIKKIEIYDSNGKVISTIENSNPMTQPTPDCPIKGAIKKYSPQPFPKLRRPNLPPRSSPQQTCSMNEPSKETIEKEMRLAKLIKLRETNFDILHGKDLSLHKDKNDPNGYLDSTADILPDILFKDSDEVTIQQFRFLFEILYEFIKSNSLVHVDKVLSKWHETKRILECGTAIDEYLDSDVIDLLLKCPKLIRTGNYLCIPETLQQTLQIFEHEITQHCKFVLQCETNKIDSDSQTSVNGIVWHKEIVTSFENQTDQNPEELLCSTNKVNENNNEKNSIICQNFDMCKSSINFIGNDSPNGRKTNNLNETKGTFNNKLEHAHYFFTEKNLLANDDIQTSAKENEDKMYFTFCKDKSSNNCNDVTRSNQDSTETIMCDDNSKSNIKHPLEENMAKNTPQDYSTKQLTSDTLSAKLITLEEKYTQLMTDYSIMEQNMAKLTKEKIDIEQNFKSQLEQKDSIMEAVIAERKILIKKLEKYESRIAKDIPVKHETSDKIILTLKSEISRLQAEQSDNGHNISLLLKEKNATENVLKKENAQLLETIRRFQAEIDKNNLELLIYQEKNLELKKCILRKSLESQFRCNQGVLFHGITYCQVAVELFNTLNNVIQRHIGFNVIQNYTVWVQALCQFQIQSVKLQEDYSKLQCLLESKTEIEQLDDIALNSVNLPPYPSKSLCTIVCDAFMIFYTHITKIQQHTLSMLAPSPVLLNPPPYTHPPIFPNTSNSQFSKENKAANSANSNKGLTYELEQKHTEDKHQNISQKFDLNKEGNEDTQNGLQHTNNDKKVQFKLEDNEINPENNIKEHIKDNNEMITETRTTEDSSTDMANDDLTKTLSENKSVSKSNHVSDNTDFKLLPESKIEEATGEENVENTKQESDKILVNSTDKLMNILRNTYTGMSESLNDVRKLHNGSLTGIPLATIIKDTNKYVLLHQIDHLCTKSETKKPVTSTTAVLVGSKKQSKSKTKKKSSNSLIKMSSNDLSFKVLTKSQLPQQSQRNQHNPVPSTSGAIKKEPVSSTKCPWDIILKPWTSESNYEEFECVICMENLEAVNKVIYTLDCKHKFHKKCIKDWFQQNQSCPTCRIHCTIDEDYPPLP